MPTSSPSPLLLDFLNRGLLPFVGRERERETLRSALRSAVEANRLRSTVLVGEAGVGKSRLTEVMIAEIEANGGIAVVTRFYPDAASTLAAPLADALWRSAAADGLLRAEPERSLSGVASAIRRVARLRPMTIVLDDLHLLSSDGVGELRYLLDLLDEEPLALLGVMRPGDAPARAVLEPTIGLEMVLEGLEAGALQPLWSALFPGADSEMVEHLHSATGGNMLAVRSALRTAVGAGALEADPRGERWKTRPERFAAAVERSIGLMAGGMTAHLSSEEIEAATRLAALGNVFARETAVALLDDPQLLDILTFKGVLAPAPAPPTSLDAIESRHPLYAFSHSLTHRSLAEEGSVDPTVLLRLLGDDLPLYTLDLVRLLATSPFDPLWPDPLLLGGMRRLMRIVRRMDTTPDWRRTVEPFDLVLRLLQWGMLRWEEGWWKTNVCRMHYYGCMVRRRDHPVRTLPLIAGMRHLTENPATFEEAGWRLMALRQEYRVAWEHSMVERLDLMVEIREVVRRFPALRLDSDYSHILSGPLSIALRSGNFALVDEIEREREELLADPECTSDRRHEIHHHLTLQLVNVIRTPEEVERRRAMFRELEEVRSDGLFQQMRLAFLLEVGEVGTMLRDYEMVVGRLAEEGLDVSINDIRARVMMARWLTGADPVVVLQELGEQLNMWMRGRNSALLLPTISRFMGLIAVLNGLELPSLDVPREIVRSYNIVQLAKACRLLDSGDHPGAVNHLRATIDVEQEGLSHLLGLLAGEEPTSELRARGLATMPLPVYTFSSFSTAAVHLRFAVACARPDDAEWSAALRAQLEVLLDWAEKMELPGALLTLLGRYDALLPVRERKRRRERCNELLAHYHHDPSAEDERHRLRVTMIGVITIAHLDGQPVPVQGARTRTLLGLMTAAAMRRTPPAREEFWSIATGVDNPDELDRARKTMHQAVLRLREALEHEAVRTDGDLPTLDTSIVRVDLLELHRRLGDVEEDLRAGLLLRARPALLEILQEVRSEVLFPTLYDEFFEAARQEFENRMRRSAVQAARALVREEDHAAAEEVLRAALVVIPEDEEMAELLADALEGLGRPADAALARLRAEREM